MAQPEQQQSIEITVTPMQWEILQFTNNITPAVESRFDSDAPPELGFSLEHMWELRADDDYVGLGLKIHVLDGVQANSKELALLEFRGNFKFSGLKRFEQNGGIGLPAQPMVMIAAMTLDTARGVLLGLGHGTLLERAALPPMPPTVLFPQQPGAPGAAGGQGGVPGQPPMVN